MTKNYKIERIKKWRKNIYKCKIFSYLTNKWNKRHAHADTDTGANPHRYRLKYTIYQGM